MSKQTAAETVGESNRDWDGHYKQGAEALPWDAPAPAPELVSFIESAESVPRKVLEVGCGTGTNAIYLASKGCDVVATDISPTAIEMAKKKCRPRPKGAVELKVSDILAASPVSSGSVDFVFDRGVFHVMSPTQRVKFIQRVYDALEPNGFWLCLAGSADERRSKDEGPPQLKASELVEPAEKRFEIYHLKRSTLTMPDGTQRLMWEVLYRKRG